ncbi:hypothetical protein RF11_02063 [Thelohanellus kitauei]|uniref:Protein kinase domain-containing protein n=1 Tax=Thelohanellus kitauei TaxID=669202 RepID=A0A0C2ILU5_THEKT|nr:hypothetical protein RF11_02063 [Thelohanellus kitauei]
MDDVGSSEYPFAMRPENMARRLKHNPYVSSDPINSYDRSVDVVIGPLSEFSYRVVDNYIMGRPLGRGAYAEVREMIDHNTLVRRAVKIVSGHSMLKIAFAKFNLFK